MKINLVKTTTEDKQDKPVTIEEVEMNEKLRNKLESTQKKNIFYYSFKNIRERYHFKENRSMAISERKDKILKELAQDK